MEVIQNRDHWVLHRLESFYAQAENLERVTNIITGKSKISLRLLDWLVTNYAKKHNVSFLTKTNQHVIVYLTYKSHLKAYSKKMFDPFCRWTKIQFMGISTTVGQLNFFEWAIKDEILDYLETHYDDIHADMEANSTVLQPKTDEDGTRRKRHELSRSATKAVRHHDVKTVVKFE